ncbi:MAG: hypothetical protein FWD45_00010 [Coriobacteriia bacterium]|nr:hypothetical protein [Coriobacteriia bacterium]
MSADVTRLSTVTRVLQASSDARVMWQRRVLWLIAFICAVDVLLVGALVFSGKPAEQINANADQVALILSQLEHNHNAAIAEIYYDPSLTVSRIDQASTSVNLADLKPLSDNYLYSIGSGEQRQTVLIDATAIAVLLAVNSDWVAYLNSDSDAVYNVIITGSNAERFLTSYSGYSIAYHSLTIGEITVDRSTVYILARPHYTLVLNGQAITVNDACLFGFVRQSSSLVLSSIEPVAMYEAADS